MVTKGMYDEGIRCKGICILCPHKNTCYQYINDVKGTKFDCQETEAETEEENTLSEQEMQKVKRLIKGIKADIQEIEEVLGYE